MVRQPLTAEQIAAGQRVGAALRAARGGRSLVEVALAAGISPETLRKIEGGRLPAPAFGTVVCLSQALAVPLSDLADVWLADMPIGQASQNRDTLDMDAVKDASGAAAYRGGVPIEMVSRFVVDDRVLSALHARAFGGDTAEVTPWAQRLARHALTWVGAFDDGRLVGFVQVCWDGGAHAFLLDTAVDPRWQHRGIGAEVVRVAAADAAAAGCQWLHVDFEAHLQDFYLQRCGFRSTSAGLLRLGAGQHVAHR